jgi:hypothetical protein
MKIHKHGSLIFTCFLLLIMTSCKKDLTSSNAGDTKTAQAVNLNTAATQCRLIHTEDDLYGYTMDVFYNRAGNPDSISLWNGFPIKMRYDLKGRLSQSNYGTQGIRFEYLYKNNSVLPVAINFYYPGVFYNNVNGLIAIFKFSYNSEGQIIKIGHTSFSSPKNNAVENYEYNASGNVTKVTFDSEDGTSSVLENKASKYDNKPNFVGGNQWLKFIMYNSGAIFIGDYFRMLSKNNVVNWTFEYPDATYPLVATYEYNNEEFANKVNFSLFDIDGVTNIGDFTELSSSTCDAGQLKSQSLPLISKKKSIMPFKNLFNLPTTVLAR